MGLEVVDPDLAQAAAGARVVTPSGMVLDGSRDRIEGPPTDDPSADLDGDGVANEISETVVDHLEFYLLNYFKAGTYQQTQQTANGRKAFSRIGCASCHMPDLTVNRDRRVADVETAYDPVNGIFNNLFATAIPLFTAIDDGRGMPSLKLPAGRAFVVRNIFTDFRRHDVGRDFYERNYDGTLRTEFLTMALWGVGTTAPYGHYGRSVNLAEVILRHHGGRRGRATASRGSTGRTGRRSSHFSTRWSCSRRTTPPRISIRGTGAQSASRNAAMAASSWERSSTIPSTPSRHFAMAPEGGEVVH
jgi:hypothetical protein